ncbi:DUF2550 domain-containing protein [Nocardioides sp.]|uniref:DUF2550 domain-containing protein n=1 Tax=Nocardioides sp. TaxID=35761 RepID=UPI0025DB7765|nr:DUF2550 domain-containing protein [Nocardioides sp.]
MACLLLLVLAYGIGIAVRRRLLERNGGVFELSHRVRDTKPGRGWIIGIGRYSGDAQLEWFRIFSLSPKPKRVWRRVEISYVSSRSPEGIEELVLYPESLIVTCEVKDELIDLSMDQQTLIGFQAWLESRPIRSNWTVF